MGYIYSGGTRFEVSDEIEKEMKKLSNRMHYVMRRDGKCSSNAYGMIFCEGDCNMCRFYKPDGSFDIAEEMNYLPYTEEKLEEQYEGRALLKQMETLIEDGTLIGRYYMGKMTDTDIYKMLGILESTYRNRKKKLQKNLKKKLAENE